uniref:Uncharacterized protein n=1 Tax=Fagus sylvatica TaxID=28930 RepID=A0A2N9HT84_FAGSY
MRTHQIWQPKSTPTSIPLSLASPHADLHTAFSSFAARRPPHRLLQLRRTPTSTPPSPASPQPTSTTKVNSDDFLGKNPNPEKKQRVRIESRGETEKGVESGGETKRGG